MQPHSWILLLVAGLGVLLLSGTAATIRSGLPDSVAPCLPCHNRPESNPVGEWLASPYSQVEGGRDCLDCHRLPCSGDGGAGGQTSPPAVPEQHQDDAARVTVTTVCSADRLDAEVVVANLGTGHDLPTGPPQRTLLLKVTARSQDGSTLPPRSAAGGPLFAVESADAVPSVHGAPAGNAPPPVNAPDRVYADDPPAGDSGTHRSRLAPFETDVSRYSFDSPGCGPAWVTARLVLLPISENPVEIARTDTLYKPRHDRPVSTADRNEVRSP